MTNTNDNLDKTLENDLIEDEEIEDEGTTTEGEEGSDDDDSSSDSDDDEDSEEEESDEEVPPVDPMAKFKDKTPEELVEMYKNLESAIERKAIEKAKELMLKGNPKGESATKDELEAEIEKMDFTKMEPKAYTKWLLAQIDKRAVAKARETYDQSNQMKTTVSRQIKEATKKYPHLKENAGYREVVISLIEAAQARGETLNLVNACAKADKALGTNTAKPGEKKVVKKPKGVERPTTGTDAKPTMSDEDRVKQGLLGGKSSGVLGGLGL